MNERRKPPLAGLKKYTNKETSWLPKKWKTMLAIVVLSCALIFSWNWFWTLLIVMGIFEMLTSGSLHFVEEVNMWENPILYWIMVAILSFLSLVSITTYYPNLFDFLS